MNYQIVIPARGGSKRFAKKNVATLGDIPLIAHSILFGLKNNIGASVFVNTDDEEIASTSLKFGANVIDRPKSLATDHTPTVDVLKHQLEYFDDHNIPCDAIILLQATNPLRPQNLIKDAVSLFEESNRSSLTSFSSLNKKFGTITESNFFTPENYTAGQRMQDLVPRYFENGLIYITKRELIKNDVIISDDTWPFIVNDITAYVDIDEEEDLEFAKFILHRL